MLLLLIVVAEHVAEQSKETRTTVFRSERDASDRLNEIARTRPKEVKLCEYSAMSVVDVIRVLAETRETESIKLLVQHPDKAANEFQKDRILQAMYRLSTTTYWRSGRLAETVSLRVRFYEVPASLRGRKFGNKYVAVGWFTHDCRNEDEEVQIWGDDNPLIVAPIRDDEGEKLAEMFDLVFDNLWVSALQLRDVLADPNLNNRYKISARWVEKVSQDDPVLDDRQPR